VLFADLLAFTSFSQGASAEVLRGVLDGVSGTLDDAYLAAAGLPGALADHTMAVAGKALDLMQAVDRFNGHNPYQVHLRLGLGAGGFGAHPN